MFRNFFKDLTEVEEQVANLYGKDWVGWIDQTVQSLKDGTCDGKDLERIMIEMQALSRQERKVARDLLKTVLMLLLRWQLFPDSRTAPEEAQMLAYVQDIDEILQESPSLRSHLDSSLQEIYAKAKALVALEYAQNC